MPAFEIGYVLANQKADDLKYASVYSNKTPKTEILFEIYGAYEEILKPGCVVSFRTPTDYEPGNCLNPEYYEMSSRDDSTQILPCKKATKYSKISFVSDAIFTNDPIDDYALESPEVHAVGFTLDFGRIIVNDDFDNSVEIVKGKKYKVAVRRYLKKGSLSKFEAYGTILICERVLSVDEDDFKQINYLQRKCPWSKNLNEVKPASTSDEAESEAIKKLPKTNKDTFFGESYGYVVKFGLVVERTQDSFLVYCSYHQKFYRVNSKFDLKVGKLYSLKLAGELDGIYQKCEINEGFLNFHADIRVIGSGTIEAVFEVQLCESIDSKFPSPWSSIYGETQHLGKVLIPDTEIFPSKNSMVKIRAIFMNKPVEDYCWIFAGQIAPSREPIKQIDNKTIAPIEQIDNNTIAPIKQIDNKTITPIKQIDNKTIAPIKEPATSKTEKISSVFGKKLLHEGFDSGAIDFAKDESEKDAVVEPDSLEKPDSNEASTLLSNEYDQQIISARSTRSILSHKPQDSDSESNEDETSNFQEASNVQKFDDEPQKDETNNFQGSSNVQKFDDEPQMAETSNFQGSSNVQKFDDKSQKGISSEEDEYVNDSDDQACGIGFGEEDALEGGIIAEQNVSIDDQNINNDLNSDNFVSDFATRSSVFDQEEQEKDNSSDRSEIDVNENFAFGTGEDEALPDFSVKLSENMKDQENVNLSDNEDNQDLQTNNEEDRDFEDDYEEDRDFQDDYEEDRDFQANYEDIQNNPQKYGVIVKSDSYESDYGDSRPTSAISGNYLSSNCSFQVDDDEPEESCESENEEELPAKPVVEPKPESSSSGSFEKIENEPSNVSQTQSPVQPAIPSVSSNDFSYNKVIRIKRNVYDKEPKTVTADSDSDDSSDGNF